MKKNFSLTEKHLFKKIINKGKRISNTYLSVFFVDSKEFKIGISVPKRLGNAVFRNKNKRQIKNILDQNPNFYNLNKKVVLIVKNDFSSLSFENKKQIIKGTLSKIR